MTITDHCILLSRQCDPISFALPDMGAHSAMALMRTPIDQHVNVFQSPLVDLAAEQARLILNALSVRRPTCFQRWGLRKEYLEGEYVGATFGAALPDGAVPHGTG
jgi:hypothetical protein